MRCRATNDVPLQYRSELHLGTLMGNIRICLKFMKLIMWNTAEENLLDLYVDSEAQGKATEMGDFDQVMKMPKDFQSAEEGGLRNGRIEEQSADVAQRVRIHPMRPCLIVAPKNEAVERVRFILAQWSFGISTILMIMLTAIYTYHETAIINEKLMLPMWCILLSFFSSLTGFVTISLIINVPPNKTARNTAVNVLLGISISLLVCSMMIIACLFKPIYSMYSDLISSLMTPPGETDFELINRLNILALTQDHWEIVISSVSSHLLVLGPFSDHGLHLDD